MSNQNSTPFDSLTADELAKLATADPMATIEAPMPGAQAIAQVSTRDDLTGILPASNFLKMGEALANAKAVITQTDTYMTFEKVGDTRRAVLLGFKLGINGQGKKFPLAKFLSTDETGRLVPWVHGGVTLLRALDGVANGSMVEITLSEQKKNDHSGKTNIFSVSLLAGPDGGIIAGQEAPKQTSLWEPDRVSRAKTWLESLTVKDGIVYDTDGVADPKMPAKLLKAQDAIVGGLRVYNQEDIAIGIEKTHGNAERLAELMRGVLILEAILTPGDDEIPF